jgi:CubicO group peptidase (beta-lactamase class C family)
MFTPTITRRTLFGAFGSLTLSRVPVAHAQERAPVPDPDWTVVDPGEVGLSEAQLSAAGDFVAVNMPDVTGIVVVRQNGLAYERYFGNEYGIDDPVDVRSISKCVTGTRVGMAIDDGMLSLGYTIGETIPDMIPCGADSRTVSITM